MVTKNDSQFFRNHEHFMNDQCSIGSQPFIESISWFSQMTRDEKLNSAEMNDVLSMLEHFLDQKEFEKSETEAELQLAYAFQDELKERQLKLIKSVTLCRVNL